MTLLILFRLLALTSLPGKKYKIEPDMVAPFSSASYEVKTLTTPRLESVSWTAVNDYGANVDVTDK